MKIGLVINPLAGIGGTVGLKGSDGDDVVRKALEQGAVPLAEKRVYDALSNLDKAGDYSFFTVNGPMGEDVLAALGIRVNIVHEVNMNVTNHTTANDTQNAVKALIKKGVDLIVFAGGDGTARDVLDSLAIGNNGQNLSTPVVGIPAGVKIHSAVYAVTPLHAGELVNLILKGEPTSVHEAQVMDLDEKAF